MLQYPIMNEKVHRQPDMEIRKRISRRKFLIFLGVLLASGTTVLHERKNIRPWLKYIISTNFPDLYQEAAELEEYGLRLLGMPVRIRLYEYHDQQIATTSPAESEIRD